MNVGDVVLWRHGPTSDAWFVGKVLGVGAHTLRLAELCRGEWTLSAVHIPPRDVLGPLPADCDPATVREALIVSQGVLSTEIQRARKAHLERVKSCLSQF